MDLAAYAARYHGAWLCARLHYVLQADRSSAAVDALLAALEKESTNTELYCSVAAKASRPVDEAWVRSRNEAAGEKLRRIERELEVNQTTQHRDKIRRSYVDLAVHHVERLELAPAIRAWTRAREYCSNLKQTVEASLMIMDLSLISEQASAVFATMGRQEVVTEMASVPSVAARVRLASALVLLGEGRFREAAESFLACCGAIAPDAAGSLSPVVHDSELALCLAITCLASFSREELRLQLLASSGAKALLERLSPAVRGMLDDFVATRYTAALDSLARLEPVVRLDLFLGPQVCALVATVRQRALQQYLAPYTAVDLGQMAAAFSMKGGAEEAEEEVRRLIVAGLCPTLRIDSRARVVRTTTRDSRAAALAAVTELAEAVQDKSAAVLMRRACERAGLVVGRTASGAVAGGKRLAARQAEDGLSGSPAGGATSAAATGDAAGEPRGSEMLSLAGAASDPGASVAGEHFPFPSADALPLHDDAMDPEYNGLDNVGDEPETDEDEAMAIGRAHAGPGEGRARVPAWGNQGQHRPADAAYAAGNVQLVDKDAVAALRMMPRATEGGAGAS